MSSIFPKRGNSITHSYSVSMNNRKYLWITIEDRISDGILAH